MNIFKTLFAASGIVLIICITLKFDGSITWFFWCTTIVCGWIYVFYKMKANYNKHFK